MEHEPSAWPPERTGWYVAFILMMANALSFVDRQALALLMEPIKHDLHVSDTAMSLLYGLSFTLFYIVVALPFARLADQSSRRNIIAIAVFIWSLATAACGVVRSFGALFVARIGVGAGEGGLGPSAYSMLSDYFPPQRLPAAMGVYQIGLKIGNAAALLIGAGVSVIVPPEQSVTLPLLGATKGWEIIFLTIGLAGVLFSSLILTIREPVRVGVRPEETSVPMSNVLAHVGSRKAAYLGIGFAFALVILAGSASAAWLPTFFERKYGWTTAQIGSMYGLVVFICGTSGTVIGGFFAAALRGRGVHLANLYTALIGCCILVPIMTVYPLMPNPFVALGLVGAMNFFTGFNFGGGLAALQELTPNRMRAMISAGYLLLLNITGGAIGPTVVALFTDYLFHNPARLPEAISLTSAIASPLAVVALIVGIRSYGQVMAVSRDLHATPV